MEADKDRDGKISFEEFTKMVENTDISMSMTLVRFFPSPFFALAGFLILYSAVRMWALTQMNRINSSLFLAWPKL